MSQQETVTETTPNKKQVRKELAEKLTGALAEYKQELGEKKLANRVKEVSKLISRDLLKISKKKQHNKNNAAKKTRTKAKAEKGAKAKVEKK
ncbi:MAG: hypothetical protein BGO55_19215 [Sphingobacteriales bacterium 50-39]|nr:hypothetical protein [Sphingobacteriales bacterium]OJW58850.1 MAG: hypothetical protein BGO55_19215 [Sphingobacteriales bacterium 50-39]